MLSNVLCCFATFETATLRIFTCYKMFECIGTCCIYYPVWHVVCLGLAVVVVQDHDGGDDARRHHEHDGVEVGCCSTAVQCSRVQFTTNS